MPLIESMHAFYEAIDDLILTLRASRGEPAHLIVARHHAWSVQRMPRAEYQRRCGYRFPLPPHMRPQEATNAPTRV